MWTRENRGLYERKGLRYQTNTPDVAPRSPRIRDSGI